jgi:hypothetical protein
VAWGEDPGGGRSYIEETFIHREFSFWLLAAWYIRTGSSRVAHVTALIVLYCTHGFKLSRGTWDAIYNIRSMNK